MGEPVLYRRVMAGRDVWSLPLRAVLRACSACYGLGVRLRNRRYDRAGAVGRVGVPVVSVGNVTTGGTGKTPLVIELARLLEQRGRRVAVLSRGYKADGDRPADELLLVSRRLPGLVCVGDPDRLGAARRVIDGHGVDAIVLDDAFQHRRVGRDLDVVVVDATCPFGYGHVLPRGLLREPLTGLRRADLIVVTRADLIEADALAALHDRLAELAPQADRVNCRHKPTGLFELDGRPADPPADLTGAVLCFSAIGNADGFEETVHRAGGDVRTHLRWPDHHRYDRADLNRLSTEAHRCNVKLLVTTEKDAVKLAELSYDWPVRVLALRIEIDFLDDGGTIVERALDRVLSEFGTV
ncbi:MAG: tetraacyldisaccharide 4'-kinase [bacterium]|nr:tetraacyldisaccharide 4'-kinase [bacterium]